MAIFQPVIPDPNKILLTDVSFWQSDIDFHKMKSMGVQGTIIRTGQRFYGDVKFKQNWKFAKEANLPRGSYWFYDSRAKPELQSELYVSMFDGDFGEMNLWCDFEERYKGLYGGWNNWYIFMNRILELVPNAKLGFYSNYYYATEFLPNPVTQKKQNEWFTQFDFWIAAYQSGQTPITPKIPKLFNGYVLHQFTDLLDGRSYGVGSNELDGNYFNGTQEEFDKFCGNQTTQPPIPPTQNTYPTINNIDITLDSGEKRLFVKR